MAMNNWGGIREHMTRKPRRVFKDRQQIRSKNKIADNKKIEPRLSSSELFNWGKFKKSAWEKKKQNQPLSTEVLDADLKL